VQGSIGFAALHFGKAEQPKNATPLARLIRRTIGLPQRSHRGARPSSTAFASAFSRKFFALSIG
jgi:hypothetical protein